MSEADVGNPHCFRIGSSALAITTDFAPLLSRIIFVGKTTLSPSLMPRSLAS
jgi:hypothetical protein